MEDSRKPDVKAMARSLESSLGQQEVESLARESRFVKRMRKLVPQALVLAIITTVGLGKADWLADILRAYNALVSDPMEYKPFHNHLKKPAFELWMMAILEAALTKLLFQVIEPDPTSKLTRFQDIYIHDGTSFALKASLRQAYPGRFSKVHPAAVELHVTMSGFKNAPERITMAADKEAERHFRPDAEILKDSLFLADRAFQDRDYFITINAAGGFFIIRGTKNIRPIIVEARNTQGKRLRRLEGKKLKWRRLPREDVDLEVEWPWRPGSRNPYRGRIVVLYRAGSRNKKEYTYLHTNLEHENFSIKEVGDLYRFRWQIELTFKEWKSHANLHAFDTGKPPIAEGLIWGSILTATLTRSTALAAELAKGVAMSTLRAARSAMHYLPKMLDALFQGNRKQLTDALLEAFDYLDCNGRRAHPKRDRERGRFRSGLRSIAVS